MSSDGTGLSNHATATTTIYLHNVLQLRAEKSSASANLSDATSSSASSLTVLQNVPLDVIEQCIASLSYYVRLTYGVTYDECADLTADEIAVYQLFNSVQNFDDYIGVCKRIVESVLENVKYIYDLYNEQKSGGGCGGDSAATAAADAPLELKSMYEMLRHMDAVFQQFYSIFTNEECFPRRLIRDKLFVSSSMSQRQPVHIKREHLADRETLFSALVSATIPLSDQSNSVFEAFFSGGFFIICLLNIVTLNYECNGGGEQSSFSRIRLESEADRECIPLLRDTQRPEYVAAVQHLPAALFDAQSDVYLSRSDTLTTVFVQFLGRVFLRLYEWSEREDVRPHLVRHLIPQNVQSLFSIVGRGPDQKAWIRFFKRGSDRQPKIFVKLEPLLQMNDELMCSASSNESNERKMTTHASPETVQRYQMLKDFLARYNGFCAEHLDRQFWFEAAARFREVASCTVEADSPLSSFETWCNDVNALIFPTNFLLIALAPNAATAATDETALRESWSYRVQQQLMNRKFTSSRCRQLYEFLRVLEVKSRLLFDEQQFMFLFSSALKSMPFLYSLFGDQFDQPEEEPAQRLPL